MNRGNKCPYGAYEIYINVFHENFDKGEKMRVLVVI